MLFVSFEPITDTKAAVYLVHEHPEQLEQHVIDAGLMVEAASIPAELTKQENQQQQLFINPQTKEMWYEYVTPELDTKEEIKLLKNPPTPVQIFDKLDLSATPLSVVKEKKIAALNYQCEQAILGNFTAHNGNVYGFKMTDQSNFNQRLTSLAFNAAVTEVQWKTENSGVLPHTREEFIKVALEDAEIHKMGNIQKYWTLKAQVGAATTIDQVVAIVW